MTESSRNRTPLGTQILYGVLAGIAAGLMFGELTAPLDTVGEITSAPKELIQRLAEDIADPQNKPVAIHVGEGINHWFNITGQCQQAGNKLL